MFCPAKAPVVAADLVAAAATPLSCVLSCCQFVGEWWSIATPSITTVVEMVVVVVVATVPRPEGSALCCDSGRPRYVAVLLVVASVFASLCKGMCYLLVCCWSQCVCCRCRFSACVVVRCGCGLVCPLEWLLRQATVVLVTASRCSTRLRRCECVVVVVFVWVALAQVRRAAPSA